MSKLFDTEVRTAGSNTAAALHQLQQKAREQDAVDSETALHMELLAQTDAKLDRVNARLERLGSELSRWAQDLYEARQAQAQVSSRRRHGPSFLATGMLLCLGAAAGALATVWQQGDLWMAWPVEEAYDASRAPSVTSWSTEPDPAPAPARVTSKPLTPPPLPAASAPSAPKKVQALPPAPAVSRPPAAVAAVKESKTPEKPQPVTAPSAPVIAQAPPPAAPAPGASAAMPAVSGAAPSPAAFVTPIPRARPTEPVPPPAVPEVTPPPTDGRIRL